MNGKLIKFFGVVLTLTFIAGCDGGKGNDFVGRWISERNEKQFMTPSAIMEIRREGDVFYIDDEQTNYYGKPGGRTKIINKKFEARAESNTVLSMMGGMLTMRLQDDRLYFGSDEYVRAD